MSPRKKILEKDVQAFPAHPNKVGKTSGAATIDTSDMYMIIFDAEVTVYFNGNSSNTYTMAAEVPKVIAAVSSIHVNAAVNYMYV